MISMIQPVIIPLHEIREKIIIKRIEDSISLNFKGTHSHNFYEILYFSYAEDGLTHTIDFKEYAIKTNCIYILKPGQVYHLKHTTQKGYLIAIKPEYLNTFHHNFDSFLQFTLPDQIQMDENDLETTTQLIKLIHTELSLKKREDLMYTLVNALITQCILSFNENIRKSGIDKRILKLIALIDNHYLREREITFYANQLSLSEKRLGVLTKQALNHTVKRLIQQRILLEAKRLISQGNLSFKSIAFQLGFVDASYFSRFFRKYSGYTPEQFKLLLK